MLDWKELALDDTLNEMASIVAEEEDGMEVMQSRYAKDAIVKKVPFCCVTTIPKSFEVKNAKVTPPGPEPGPDPAPETAKAQVAWNDCLNLRLKKQNICVKPCEDQQPCGNITELPALVTALSGCIQFIASTEVTGKEGSTSNVCCKGCVCVDECVNCQVLQTGAPCPDELGSFTVAVENTKVCVDTCGACDKSIEGVNSKVVKFTGEFVITYTKPNK